MKRHRLGIELVPFLFMVFLVGNSIAFQSSRDINSDLNVVQSFPRSPRRSLMSISPEPSTALIAALDGTIHLVESNSKRVIWSFQSGPPIYSAYHQPQNLKTSYSSSFYIDCGEDWDLYAHSHNNGTMKLPMSIQEFVESTPYVSEDGAVTLGSKKTTVFEVDPETGSLIRSYASSGSPSVLEGSEDGSVAHNAADTANKTGLVPSDSNGETPTKLHLQIMRTDYTLKSFAPKSDKVSWSMTVAEIAAVLLCQGVDKDIALPLPCESKAFVFRHRSHVLLEKVRPEGPLEPHDQDTALDIPTPDLMLPSQAKVRRQNKRDQMLPLQLMGPNDSNLQDEQHGGFQYHGYALKKFVGIALIVGAFLGITVYHYALQIRAKVLPNEQLRDANSKVSTSKKKKNQKSESSNGITDKKDNHDSFAQNKGEGKSGLDLNKLFDCGADGQRIGKLVVSTTEIAKGSNGTVVLEGFHDGRPVAVKRLVQAHHDVALKEIQNLIASDRHPNVVRWFGVEHDQYFIYLSLERCTCSLDNLIQIYSDSSKNQASGKDHAARAIAEHKVQLESVKNNLPNVKIWKANDHPSPLLLKLMRDVVSGLVHLHQLGIIHRDLKPQNVLITSEISLCAKLSDMGISKRLLGDMSSLGQQVTGCGSSGWQAPEQLLHGRQTRAVDLFSLGCVLFFCVTHGRHPFGDSFERDMNIVNNRVDFFLLESMPEAIDLISRLLNPDPESRPKASEVFYHPLFWDSETRLSFLRDTSDRLELKDRDGGSELLKALESIAPIALNAKWNEKMEPLFLANIGQYRRYKFDSVRDLLRVMRNKLNHYRELPLQVQELVGGVPEGFDDYFASRFPRLLIEVYKVINVHCKEEECFQKYYKSM